MKTKNDTYFKFIFAVMAFFFLSSMLSADNSITTGAITNSTVVYFQGNKYYLNNEASTNKLLKEIRKVSASLDIKKGVEFYKNSKKYLLERNAKKALEMSEKAIAIDSSLSGLLYVYGISKLLVSQDTNKTYKELKEIFLENEDYLDIDGNGLYAVIESNNKNYSKSASLCDTINTINLDNFILPYYASACAISYKNTREHYASLTKIQNLLMQVDAKENYASGMLSSRKMYNLRTDGKFENINFDPVTPRAIATAKLWIGNTLFESALDNKDEQLLLKSLKIGKEGFAVAFSKANHNDKMSYLRNLNKYLSLSQEKNKALTKAEIADVIDIFEHAIKELKGTLQSKGYKYTNELAKLQILYNVFLDYNNLESKKQDILLPESIELDMHSTFTDDSGVHIVSFLGNSIQKPQILYGPATTNNKRASIALKLQYPKGIITKTDSYILQIRALDAAGNASIFNNYPIFFN